MKFVFLFLALAAAINPKLEQLSQGLIEALFSWSEQPGLIKCIDDSLLADWEAYREDVRKNLDKQTNLMLALNSMMEVSLNSIAKMTPCSEKAVNSKRIALDKAVKNKEVIYKEIVNKRRVISTDLENVKIFWDMGNYKKVGNLTGNLLKDFILAQ
eukprot:TRINITY_DN8176_c0_g1_i1.p1 TRINITY_DN8176_c0_g1~~TRINITY_DN8176_c0_g1_i1.p1  ORF type:complete len:156 (+),score=49.72 TRINITY_DN8176_c0_g1_i1:203-670(+)